MKTPEDFDTPEEYDVYFEYMANNNAVPLDTEHRSTKLLHNIRNEIEIQISFEDASTLERLRKDLVKITRICTKNNSAKYDYRNNYKKRYQALKNAAEELEVNIAQPLPTAKDIRVKITAIYRKYYQDERYIKIAINDLLNETIRIDKLPNLKDVNSKIDEYEQIKKELEENYPDV